MNNKVVHSLFVLSFSYLAKLLYQSRSGRTIVGVLMATNASHSIYWWGVMLEGEGSVCVCVCVRERERERERGYEE